MTIGALGDVSFYVSDKAAQTFTNMKWKSSAKYSTHDLHMKKGILELTGYDPDELSFSMKLSAFLGVNPRKAMDQLESMKNAGKVVQLVLGTKIIGKRWVVKEISRTFDTFYKDGSLVEASVDVSLTEYS